MQCDLSDFGMLVLQVLGQTLHGGLHVETSLVLKCAAKLSCKLSYALLHFWICIQSSFGHHAANFAQFRQELVLVRSQAR